MSGINDNVKLLYDALKKEGYGNLGSVEQFDGLLKDSGNREYLYKSMKDEGFSDLGEYSEFESMLGYQMPEDLKQSKGVLRSDINPEPVNLRPEYTGPTQEQPDYVNPLTNSPEYNFESIKQKGKIETVTPNDPYENIFQSISDNRTGLDDAIKEAMKGNVREGVRPIDVSTNLIAARDYLNEAEELINAKKEGAGLFRGIANAFTNRRTWDFGMSDFATNKSVKNAIDKFEKGDELSDDETRLLDALAVNTAAKAYTSDIGYGYDIGSGFVQSIPFMIEMAINPLSGSGKAIGKKLASYAAKRFSGKAGNLLGKVGRVAGDVAGSTAMAATTGAPGVAADYYARSTGTPVVSSDFGEIELGQVAVDPFGEVIKNDKGKNMMIGSVDKESDIKAMYKALAARSIDNFSEMFGAYFGPIGDAIKNSRLGKRLSVSAVGKKLDQLTTEDWVKSFNSLLKDAKYDGFIGETAEEYVGGLINSVMVGDQSLSDLASLDNLIRTAGTVGLMSGIFGSVNLAGVRTAKYKAGRDLENSENRIFDSVGEEEFDDFINKMDSSDPDKRADIIRDIIKSDKYDNIQKAMFMDYYHKRMVYDGFVYGQAKKNQEGKPTEEDQEASVDAVMSQENMSQGQQSFERISEESRNVGRNMTSRDEMYAASNDMKAKRNDLESMDSGLAQTIDNYIKDGASYNEVTGLMDGLPADLRSKAEAYYQSQMVVTGAQEKVLDDIDQSVNQVEKEVTPYIKTTEDGRRVFTTANFDEGLYHGPVYVMKDDGNNAVIYQDGQMRMVDSARLSDKKDNDLDTVLSDLRDQMIASSEREMDLYLNHSPKTRYPEPGLVVFNGKDAFILQGQDENGDWSAFPAVFDKETGQVTAKANGTPSILTEREILELQDNAYASQDIPVNEQVQQEQQPEQTIKTSEIEGENATSPSSGESNVSQETPQSDLDRVIASLPKKDDGSIDYKSMSPSQQYDYTSLTESPETALSDLQQDVEAKKKEVEDIEAKIAKATGGERAELRDQARAKRKEYEELTAFYNSVAPAPVPAEIQQEVQEPVQAVEKQEVKQEKPIETEKSKTTEKKTDKNNEVDNYLGLEEVGAPLNAHELAAKMMANGSIRLTRDSYMKETGFGEEEAKKMFGLFYKPENGGVSVERAGEILTQADSEGGYNFIDPNDPNAARDVIIDVLSQAKTRGDLINYIKRRREEMANRERQAAYNDYAKWTQDNFGMTPEEWEAYNDAVDRDIRSIGITDEELRAIDGEIYDDMLAEQQDYAEIYGQLNQERNETNQGNEQGRDQEPGEGGGEVLPTEQPVETGRDGVVEGEREAGDDVNRQDDGAQAGEGESIREDDNGMTENQRAVYDSVVGMLEDAGIQVEVLTDDQMKALADNNEITLEAKRKSETRKDKDRVNGFIDEAISMVTGKSVKDVRSDRLRREQERRDKAKKIYDSVLDNDFNDVTLRLINEYIDEATPNNPYGRRISQRVPQKMERRLHEGNRTNAIDALFTRISESAVGKAGEKLEGNRGSRERAKEKKKELLKGWAIATGNWHTDISDFTNDKEPVARGKDSDVYYSKDGEYVIKFSKGKKGNRFPSDIDAPNLFGYIFPNTAYDIIGYGEIDGNFVTILRQPIVDIESALTEDDRVEYMRSLGFDPINKDNTAFSNGEVIVADLQKGNVVRTKEGNVRVIDADVKLHTKDLGGKYSYLPVDVDTENRINLFKDNNGVIYGATIGGKIYLNGSALNPETPIHEYTHIWDEACRRNNPELWNRGVDLMRQTSVWNDVKNDPNYSNLETDDEIASEVHSRLTGKDGARILEEMVDSSNKQETSDLREKLKKWLDDFWWWLKDTMMPWTKNEVSRVTLNDFVNMPLKDLANGKRINQENNTVRFRFIGERGAYNLDQAEEATTRMDNLNVARNMEKANNEKKMRIEKLKTSNPVEITGDEIEPSDDLKQYKKNALEYGKRLRGEYTNKDTGVTVILSSGNKNGGLKEVLQHDINDIDHLKSVAAIPGILENSIYIETVDNEEVDKNPNVARYHYYVCGLKIGDTDYTVKAVVAEQNNGNRYYDHKLTEIEKGKLLDELAQLNQTSPSGLSSTGELEETEQSRPAASRGGTQSSPVSKYKDTRLMSILQTDDRENAKKIKLATGWERGADGKWRYETPDFSFKENPVVVPFDGYVLTNLGALINDEELFKAYPELEDMTVQYQNLPLGMLASYSPKTNRFPAMITMDDEFIRKKENPEWRKLVEKMEQEPVIKKWIEEMEREPFDETLYNKAEKDFKESPLWEKYNDLLLGKGKVPRYVSGFSGEKILAHEIQHAIQDIEGFAKGGNTRNTQYNNFAGEVESRNVEKRFDLSPEGRSATLAEETEDVAREDQIFINNALNNNKSLFYEPNTRNNQSKEARPEANREDSRARTETVEANGNFGAQDNTPVGSTGRETAEANDGVYNGDRVNGQQTGNYDRASDQGTGRENRPANGDIDGQDGQRAVGYDAGRGEQGQRDIDSGERNNLGNIQPGDNRGATDNGDRGTNNVDQRVDGKSDRAGDIDQGRDRFIRAANETARSLGTTVRIINNIDELPDSAVKDALSQGRKITGWYDIPSGQVYVYAPNLTSENEAKKTVLHEAVAHKGLRQVIGNDAYDKEMVKLFDKLPEDERMEVSRMAQERYGGETAVAMDEYLAEKAELDETPSFWEKVISSVRRMLRKVGIDMSLNEGDVKYLLWRGRKSLNEKDPFEVAKDLVMRSRNGIGQKGQTRMREARTEVEQSSPTGGSTTKAWDDLVSSDAYLMEESLFDYLLSVDKFQKLITGKDKSKVLDYENAYHALLQVSSVNRSEMDIFDASLLSSLNEAISKLVGKRKRKWKWESGPERDLVKYVEAKHGIERNRDLAVRDGMASLREMPLERLVSSGIMSKEEYKSFSDKVEKEADEEARKFKDRIMPQILKRESRKEGMTEEGAREIAEKESERRAAKVKDTYIKKAEAELKEDKIKSINDRWVRGRAEIRSKNMSWENKQKSLDNLAKSLSWKDKFGSFGVKWGKDYSGLSSVFKDDADKENTGWDERAREFVKSYEESHDQESIKGLWDSVKKITDFSLWKQRQSGLVDQQYVNDNMDRFEYFVPLRGFNDEIASDVYQYFGDGQSLAGNPVKSASGRMSEADNPFSGMLSVAYASIASGNKNITKQKFLNFVRNHDTDGLVTVNNIWIRNVGTEENPDWQEVAPEIPDNATSEEVAKAVNDFEAQMEELAEQGLAEKIKGGKSRIPYKTLGRQRNEHQVQVLVGGNRYVLTVNGNPRVAQAINGLMNPDVNMNGFFEYGKRVQVFMAGMFTSKNVAFSMVNLTRDLSYSNNMTFINESPSYWWKFTKNQVNLVKNLPRIGKMLYDYNRGKLDPKDDLSKYFKEFMDNGGATGYTFIESQREYSGKLAKMLDRLSEGNLSNMNPAKWTRLMFDMFEFMGNTTEILNRLAAYETSREKGRSVSRSIMDAKEVTVNFSRKGAGIKSVNKDTKLIPKLVAYTSQFGRSYILFWNASLQGKRKLLKSAMNHPIKTGSAFVAAPICMGMAVPLLNNVFLPALYNMVGLGSDDDKEDYFDVLSDWQRQSNICIRLPKGYWLKLPLSPDIANFYGLGDKIHAHLAGKRDLTIMDGVETIVDTVSPIGINWNYQGTALALNVLPTVFQPLAQTMMNTNFMGNPIKKESFTRSSELDPEYTKVYKSASSSLVELSKLTNDLSGGDAIRSGSVNWNPAILQNLLTGYTGGFGTVALGVADAIVDASKGDTQGISATRYPLLSRFVAGGDPEVKKRRINSNYQTVVVDFVNKIMHDYDGYQKKLEDPTLNELDYAEYYTKMGKIESSEDFMKAMDLQNYIDQITDINKTLKEFGDDELLESEMYELMLEAIDIKRGEQQQ